MASSTVLYFGSPDDAVALSETLDGASVLATADATDAERYLSAADIDLVAVDPAVVNREAIDDITALTGATVVAAGDEDGTVDRTVPREAWPGALSESPVTDGHRRFQSEQALLRSIFTDIPDVFYAFDEDGQFFRWSDHLSEMTGYADEEIAEMHPVDFFEGEDVERVATALEQVFERDEAISVEADVVTEDGDRLPHEFTGARLQSPDGTPLGLVGVGRDISERQSRKRELLQYETVVETVSDGIYTTDADSRFTVVNDALVELTGYPREELLGRDVEHLLVDEEEGLTAQVREQFTEDPDQVVTAECDIETADERTVPVVVHITSLPSESGFRGMAGVMRNASEQRKLERQLRALHQTSRNLIVAESEQEIAELAVEAAEEIIGLPITALWRYDERRDRLKPIAETDTSRVLFDEIPTFEAGEALAWDVFETGEMQVFNDVRSEPRRANPDTSLRTEIIAPLGDYGVMATGTTEEVEYDERAVELFRILAANVEAALLRTERERQLRTREQELARQNERLDEFASVVAHDLRNPLSVATGYLALARDGDTEAIDHAEEALDRIDDLIDDLLMLARGGISAGDTAPISVGTAARSAWDHVETHDSILEPAEPPTVEADRSSLQQALENLFRNAIEHGGPDVTVTVGALEDAEGFYVADDGPGIPEEDRDQVFEYGFSGASGTGLGLAIVRNVAEGHGWAVTATESENGGARFDFRTG